MKNLKLDIIFICFLLQFYACKESNEPIKEAENTPFCAKSLEANLRHERITEVPLFDACDARNLFVLVDLSECDTDEWDCAISGAISSYNSLPNDIGIGMTMISDESELPPGEQVNITIKCDFLISGIGNMVNRRESPEEVTNLLIHRDPSFNPPCSGVVLDCCHLQKTVMHELGHALCLGHTQGGTPGAEWIPGTPMGEPNSIMNSSTEDDCNGGCIFTNGDLKALRILYDACNCPDFVPGDPCDCPNNVENICDCPDAVQDQCDCPETVENPCNCPEVFEDRIDYVCTCICYEWSRDYYFKPPYTGFREISREVVDCDENQCAGVSDRIFCQILRECIEVEPGPTSEDECYCDCGLYTFPINCDQNCPSDCEKKVK